MTRESYLKLIIKSKRYDTLVKLIKVATLVAVGVILAGADFY